MKCCSAPVEEWPDIGWHDRPLVGILTFEADEKTCKKIEKNALKRNLIVTTMLRQTRMHWVQRSVNIPSLWTNSQRRK